MSMRFEYDGRFTGWAYEDTHEPRVITKDGEIIDYNPADIDTQNRLDSSLDSMEDGFNKLDLIDGTWYEVYFDGIYTIRRKVTNAQNIIRGGECRFDPGKACDYILIEDEDGTEIAYDEEMIPEDATEAEADWDPERVNRLIASIREALQ